MTYRKFRKNRWEWKKRKRFCYKEKIQSKWNNYLLKFENNALTSIIEKKTKKKKKSKVKEKNFEIVGKIFPEWKNIKIKIEKKKMSQHRIGSYFGFIYY